MKKPDFFAALFLRFLPPPRFVHGSGCSATPLGAKQELELKVSNDLLRSCGIGHDITGTSSIQDLQDESRHLHAKITTFSNSCRIAGGAQLRTFQEISKIENCSGPGIAYPPQNSADKIQ